MRLRGSKSSDDGNDQREYEYPSPARLVIPNEPCINVINNQNKRHARYKQENKTPQLIWHARNGFTDDEDHCGKPLDL
jgi:hypothetical protein